MTNTDLAALDREDQIWQLRLSGLTYKQIGAQVGLSDARICQILNARITETSERINDLRKLQTADLMSGLDAIRPKVESGELGAIHTLTKVWERLSKLYGLDAPQQLEIDHTEKPWLKIYEYTMVEVDPAEEQRQTVRSVERPHRRAIEGS